MSQRKQDSRRLRMVQCHLGVSRSLEGFHFNKTGYSNGGACGPKAVIPHVRVGRQKLNRPMKRTTVPKEGLNQIVPPMIPPDPSK